MADLDRLAARLFDDQESAHLGSGWWSGVLAVFFGALGFCGVVALRFPELLTTPSLRATLPLAAARGLIQVCLGAGFFLGLISASLRRRKVLGFTGMALALAASLLGGSSVRFEAPGQDAGALGLDWFAINVLLTALFFVPIERAFPRLAGQSTFRPEWTTDAAHFLVSHLLVQVSIFLTLAPARAALAVAGNAALRAAVTSQPLFFQFLEIVLVADLTEYAIHRTFHATPWLWPFHAVHHSARSMDWLAGSRLHIVDIVLTRGLTFVPLYVLGFSDGAIYAYLAFVSFHAVFIHANVAFDLSRIEGLVATPRFHHWHHADAREAVDKNFAVHLPLIDRVFGTYYAPPGEWPAAYGLSEGRVVPPGYAKQLVWPFRELATNRPSPPHP